MGKNFQVGITPGKLPSKGSVRDNNFKDRQEVKGGAPRAYQSHPGGVEESSRGTAPVKGKLGG